MRQPYEWICAIALLVLVGCGTTGNTTYRYGSELQPRNINNACQILLEKPHWTPPLITVASANNTSVSTILAIIYQESSFNATARPKRSPVTNKSISSAYGYAQALDGTWEHYQKQTHKSHYRRDVFAHAVDFIGWYTSISHKKNNIPQERADLLYLNYHEGWGGYARKTHLQKPWLLQTAKQVQARKHKFDRQLQGCDIALQNSGQGKFRVPDALDSDMRTQGKKKYQGGWF